jgi:hypothetical protein
LAVQLLLDALLFAVLALLYDLVHMT